MAEGAKGAKGSMSLPPDYDRSLNPISNRGGYYPQHITNCPLPPDFYTSLRLWTWCSFFCSNFPAFRSKSRLPAKGIAVFSKSSKKRKVADRAGHDNGSLRFVLHRRGIHKCFPL